ncbi:threonine synthase [Anaeromyxobacter oryzisoli]|uniref:threonine synthase n=1 Tax=Anaeromyxobacter oryzisoli TaxID=2925408 RepID=UPI001F5AF768|nr:threonine synthase [Anaeromyxobacter sp. SG63]
MSSSATARADAQRRGPRLAPLTCRLCGAPSAPSAVAVCERCLGPLEPAYDPHRRLPTRAEIEARPETMWRYLEWLPFLDAPVVSLDVGFTPLVDSPALARALGVHRALVKNDAASHPTFSFKDRVVASALNAALGLGLDTVGCASTGNLANAVAAQAARAGLAAWIFIPEDLEIGKIVGTAVYGPRLVRVKGTYDDVNRLCAQVADRFGFGLVNLNLRSYYGEGSKTMAFEIGEQLGWRTPDAIIAPMAGGSLVTKLDKGFRELRTAGLLDGPAPRVYGAQATGCAPIVNLVESGGEQIVPVQPRTIARSLAIGNPADGRFAAKAIRESGGAAAAVTDEELVAGIRLLAETTGVFGETAAGVTVASALKLARAGALRPSDELVLCVTGNGLKTVEAVLPALPESPVVAPKLREVAALVERSR